MIQINLSHVVTIEFDRLVAECTNSQLQELILQADTELTRRLRKAEWAESFDVTDTTTAMCELPVKKERAPKSEADFREIFEYGNENSGSLMWARFQNEYNGNLGAFRGRLCQIDAMKLSKWMKGGK